MDDESPLPVDFDGSLDPSRLPNVTLGNHSIMETSHRKPYSPMSLSSKYNGAGRRSPVKTIKEYDQQVGDLTKENFNLKLRIYHLEERMGRQYGDEQNVFKTNIELKIAVDHLKNELAEKQVYLQKAAQAVSTLTLNHQQAEDAIRDECGKDVEELKAQLDSLTQECEASRKQAEEANKEVESLLDGLKLAHMANEDLSEKFSSAQTEMDLLESKLKDSDGKVQELTDLVSSLQKQVERKDRDMTRLSICFGDEKRLEPTSILEPQHLQDKYDDKVEEVTKLKGKIASLEDELMTKDSKLQVTEKELHKKLEELDNKTVKLGKLEQTANALMHKVRNAGKNNEEKDARLKDLESEVSELNNLLDAATKEKSQIVNDSMVVQETNDRLLHQMREVKEMAEDMAQSLGRKQGEMSAFQEQLHKAMDALTNSERAVEDLQMQLKKERAEFESKLKHQAKLFENTSIDSDSDKEITSLRQQLAELKKSLADQNVAHLRQERELSHLDRQNKHLKDMEGDLKAERESQEEKVQLLQREIKSLRLELESRDLKIGRLQQNTVHIERACHEGNRLDVNVQVLPLNVTEELHLLLGNVRQELLDVKVLQDSLRNLQCSNNDGVPSNEEVDAVQKVFKKLEDGLDRNSQLHQHLLNFLQQNASNKDSNDTVPCPTRQLAVPRPTQRQSFLPRPVGSCRESNLLGAHVEINSGLSRKDNNDPTDKRLQLSDLGRESLSPLQRLSDCEIPSHLVNDNSGGEEIPASSCLLESGELLDQIVADFTLLDHSLTDDAKEGNLRQSSSGDGRDFTSLNCYFEPRLQDSTLALNQTDTDNGCYRHFTLSPKGQGQAVTANETTPQQDNNLIDLFTEPPSSPVGNEKDCDANQSRTNNSNYINGSGGDETSSNMDKFSNITRRSSDFRPQNDVSRKKSGDNNTLETMFGTDKSSSDHKMMEGEVQTGLNDSRHLNNNAGRNSSYLFVTDRDRSVMNTSTDSRWSNITLRSRFSTDVSGNRGGDVNGHRSRTAANETFNFLEDEVDGRINESRLSRESGRGGKSPLHGIIEQSDSQSDPDIVKSTTKERRDSWADELAPYRQNSDEHDLSGGTSSLHANSAVSIVSMEKGRGGDTTSHHPPSMNCLDGIMSPPAITLQNQFPTSPAPSTKTLHSDCGGTTSLSSPERPTMNGNETTMANSSSLFDDVTPVDLNNSGEREPDDPTLTSVLVTDFTFLSKRLSILSQSILPSPAEQSFSNTTIDVDKLHARLAHLERIILMQKEEITVYESLLTAMGVSVPLSTSNRVNEGSGSESGEVTNESLLRQHLVEIRRLRQRLENLDLGNDSDQLLIFHHHTQQRISYQERTISQLQQTIVESEDKWHREMMETDHRWNRERTQLVQKLETSQAEVNSQRSALQEQEKMIQSLKKSLWQEEEGRKEAEKEVEKLRQEKCELEEDLSKREREYLDMENTMFQLEMAKEEVESEKNQMKSEIEEREKQVTKLKHDVEHYKESCQSLRDVVRGKSDSLQEQIQCTKKLAQEKAGVDQKLSQLQTELEELREDADKMRSEVEDKKVLEDELVQLQDDFAFLKNSCEIKTREQMQILGQKVELETKVSKLNEEKLKMEADGQKRISELRQEVENTKKEMSHMELKTQQGLGEEIASLRSMLEKKRNLELELGSRLSELESDLRKEEAKRAKVEDELRERTEKVKKRDRQCQYLCDRFRRLDKAYTKQDTILKFKTEAVNSMKRQVQVYEQTIAGFSKDNQGTMQELFQELMLTKKQVADLLARLEESSKELAEVQMDSYESIGSRSSTTTTTTTTEISLKSTSLNSTTTSGATTTSVREDDFNGMEAAAGSPKSSPMRNPGVPSPRKSSPMKCFDVLQSPSKLSPMKSYEVQSLSAVYKLDQHEKAKKEAGECLVSLSGVEARVEDRLKAYKAKTVTESVDYSTLREAGMACQQMRACLNEICTIISCAWITELPPVNDQGRFYDPESLQEKEKLKLELNELESKYALLDLTVKDQREKLNLSKQREKDWENSVCRQLARTSHDLEQAKENLNLSRGILQQVNTSAQANSTNDSSSSRANTSLKSVDGDASIKPPRHIRGSIQSENE